MFSSSFLLPLNMFQIHSECDEVTKDFKLLQHADLTTHTHTQILDVCQEYLLYFQVLDGHFVHYFAPKDLPVVPKNVVFVIDTSASMVGTKIKQVNTL